MRSVLLWVGLASSASLMIWACGDEVETATAATTTGPGGGGMGGGATSSSTTTSTTGGSGGEGGMVFDDVCDEACFKVEETCGFTGACGFLPPGCDGQSQCVAGCINDPMVDCLEIASIVNGGPLCTDCIAPCLGQSPCMQCAVCACGQQFFACGNDMDCGAFLTCAQMCADGDGACLLACQQANPGMATDELVGCLQGQCPVCTQGGAGGGGMGGAGMGGAP
jgi:hypothetical protein